MRQFIIPATVVLTILLVVGCADMPREEQLTTEQKIERITEDLPDIKMELAMEGKYACCLKEGCNACILAHGSCPCYNNLKEGKAVCGECYIGWQTGNGVEGEFTREQVRFDDSHAH
jgi:hypothetical protein